MHGNFVLKDGTKNQKVIMFLLSVLDLFYLQFLTAGLQKDLNVSANIYCCAHSVKSCKHLIWGKWSCVEILAFRFFTISIAPDQNCITLSKKRLKGQPHFCHLQALWPFGRVGHNSYSSLSSDTEDLSHPITVPPCSITTMTPLLYPRTWPLKQHYVTFLP